MSYIYKISNTENEKVYIGQTSYSLQVRFKQHIEDSIRYKNLNRPLYQAFKEIGIDKFFIDLIEETENFDERERFWIDYYDSYNNGYNGTIGGQGKLLYNHLEIIQEYLTQKSAKLTAKKFECHPDTVLNILKANNISIYKGTELFKKRVQRLSLKDDVIDEFESLLDAGKFVVKEKISGSSISTSRTHISEVCNQKRKTAYGYKWKFLY